jgi:cation:H+ antiporter
MTLGLIFFAVGAALAIWATERLLEGLVGLAALTRISTFTLGAVLSGLEAENIAVGLAAGAAGQATIALGVVFGGATFLLTVALGLGAVLYPLRVELSKGVLATMAGAPVLAGVALAGSTTPRLAGALLLVAFVVAMVYIVRSSARRAFAPQGEVKEALEKHRSWPVTLLLTVVGLGAISVGGELVSAGASRLIAAFRIPALLMGMVITPAVIELEEVARQAIPAREGRPEVSVGNLVGTLLFFVLVTLGLVALITPVRVDPAVRTLDWPFLVATTWLVVLLLARGRLGRREGAFLLAVFGLYVALHVLTR